MKLADKTVEIHSRGISSSNQFTIQQSSKMFKLLSDSLYSDKVMAVIRELSTNAYDAHVASGNKNPFKVTLPTQANSNFIVRDYGTGLSREDMENLYTTYGASNKNDSNDFIGCLGLGSKSPFAYTNSFSATSYYNRKSYTYIAAIDQEGVPNLNLISVADTNEPNGLEISFAVKNYDFNEFTHKFKRIFHYFKMKPIVYGGTGDNLSDHSYSHHNAVIEGSGWKIGRVSNNNNQYPSQWHSPGSSVVAIMGNIAYPVDADKIIGEEKEQSNDAILRWNRTFKKADVDSWKNLVKEIISSGLYLEIQFNIGELDVDISREGLQYTKNVIKILRERTQDIYLQLKEDMSKKLEQCTNLVDAYTTYYNLSDIAGGWTAGASWTDANGKVHELQSGKDLEYSLKKNKQLYVFNFRTAGYRSRRLVYLTDKIHYQTLQGVPEYHWSGSKRNGKMVFFRCDVKGAETAKKIITRYCNQSDCYAYLMIDTEHPEDSTQGFDDIINDIGGENNVLNVSDYKSLIAASPRKTIDSMGSISKDEIFILRDLGSDKNCKTLGGNGMNDSSYLRELSDDLVEYLEDEDNEIVYVPIVRYGSLEGYPDIHSICMLADNKEIVIGEKLFDGQKIFAIKSSAIPKLKNEGFNLVCFNDWLKKWTSKIVTKLSKKVTSYTKIMKYSKDEYHSKDNTYKDATHYYGVKFSDRNIMFHIINLFGLDYRKYIKNTDMCDAIDQWFMIEFFAESIHNSGVSFSKAKKEDYFAHIATILSKHGINGIDPSGIRDAYQSLNNIKHHLNKLYSDPNNVVSESLDSSDENSISISNLPKMTDIRKNLKDEVDKSPMLKYIIGSNHHADYGRPKSINPLKVYHNDGHYNNKPAWFTTIGDESNIESFKTTLGSLI
jgi:hypothetical protein